MIREAIMMLSQKKDLSYEMAETVMNEIMSGEASDIQMSAYLTALAMKGETIDEITASAAGMRAHCVRLLNDIWMCWRSWGLAETAPTLLISPPPQRLSSRLAEFRWQSTATGRLPANAALPMCWRCWG